MSTYKKRITSALIMSAVIFAGLAYQGHGAALSLCGSVSVCQLAKTDVNGPDTGTGANGLPAGQGDASTTTTDETPATGDCSSSMSDTKTCDDPAVNGAGCAQVDSNCDLIKDYINPFINFLSALVGVGVLITLITGGIMYSQSAGDPQKVGAAKKRIRNGIIALVAFAFLYAFVNFLIPGGVA